MPMFEKQRQDVYYTNDPVKYSRTPVAAAPLFYRLPPPQGLRFYYGTRVPTSFVSSPHRAPGMYHLKADPTEVPARSSSKSPDSILSAESDSLDQHSIADAFLRLRSESDKVTENSRKISQQLRIFSMKRAEQKFQVHLTEDSKLTLIESDSKTRLAEKLLFQHNRPTTASEIFHQEEDPETSFTPEISHSRSASLDSTNSQEDSDSPISPAHLRRSSSTLVSTTGLISGGSGNSRTSCFHIFDSYCSTQFQMLHVGSKDTVDQVIKMYAKLQNLRENSENPATTFHMYVMRNGVEQRLDPQELVLLIQNKWFEQFGYCEGEYDYILERQNFSGFFKFYVCYSTPFERLRSKSILDSFSALPSNHRLSLSSNKVRIVGQNIYTVPTFLSEYARGLRLIDFSHNRMLQVAPEFCYACQNVAVFRFARSHIDQIPYALFSFTGTLKMLNLGGNFLQDCSLASLNLFLQLTFLDIKCNRIKSLPDCLGSMKKLRYLNISNNFLQVVPQCITEMKSLNALDISLNYLSEIPESINNLRSLSRLNIAGNAIMALPAKLVSCRSLSRVQLQRNAIKRLDCFLEDAQHLISITAQVNSITNVTVNSAPRLATITLSKNPLSKIEFTAQLFKLRSLQITFGKLCVLPSDLFSFCPNLDFLALTANLITSIPSSLSCLSKLRSLRLDRNKLERIDLAGLDSLEVLDLHDNNLSRLPDSFWSCSKLLFLNISSNLLSALPNINADNDCIFPLVEFHAAENRFDNKICNFFKRWPNLRILNLNFNSKIGFLTKIHHLSLLEQLYLSNIGLQSVPTDIRVLKRLTFLYLDLNYIFSLPAELSECQNLQVVDVSYNHLRYNIYNSLYEWNWNSNPGLKYLNLTGNSNFLVDPRNAENSHLFCRMPNLEKVCVIGCSNLQICNCPMRYGTLVCASPLNAGVAEYFPLKAETFFVDCAVSHRSNVLKCGDFTCAMFNGHPRIITYLNATFLNILASHAIDASVEFNIDVLASILRRSFLEMNFMLKCIPESEYYGASALLLFKYNNHVCCCNIGDTMAVLSRDGRGLLLSTRHHTRNQNELWRLRSAGTYVAGDGTFEDELSLTKSFGYFNYIAHINAAPSIHEIGMKKGEFVIIASRGLWEIMSYQSAIDIVNNENGNYAVAARKLRDIAIGFGADLAVSIAIVGLEESFSATSDDGLSNADGGVSFKFHREQSIMDTALARLNDEIAPPMGRVTFVFTDIKGSSKLWAAKNHAMASALLMHNSLLRRLLRKCGGYEVKTEGDAFMTAFPDVKNALKWCLLVQKCLVEIDWPKEIFEVPEAAEISQTKDRNLLTYQYRGLSVRIGIHVGAPVCNIDPVTMRMDYFGLDLTIASRVRDLADGGQIFITDAVFSCITDPGMFDDWEPALHPNIVPIGLVSLKGVPDKVPVYAVYPACLSLRHDFCSPSLKSSSGRSTPKSQSPPLDYPLCATPELSSSDAISAGDRPRKLSQLIAGLQKLQAQCQQLNSACSILLQRLNEFGTKSLTMRQLKSIVSDSIGTRLSSNAYSEILDFIYALLKGDATSIDSLIENMASSLDFTADGV